MRFCVMALVCIGCSNIGLLLPLTGAVMNFSRTEFRLWALDHFCKQFQLACSANRDLTPSPTSCPSSMLLLIAKPDFEISPDFQISSVPACWPSHTHPERFPAAFWKEVCLNEGETRQWQKGINLQNYFFAVVEHNFFFVNAIKS